MSDNSAHLIALYLLQKTMETNAALNAALKESEDLHREKDQTISWMGGGYSVDSVPIND